MAIKSISGVTFQVANLSRTAAFYESLGFRLGKKEEGRFTVYVNWFWIEFQKGEAAPGDGVAIAMSVDDVEASYDDIVKKDLKPEGEPQPTTSGRREFILKDPDGYSLLFFEKA